MLRVSDSRAVMHVNSAEPHHVVIPSRRDVLAAFERMLSRIEDGRNGDLYVDLAAEIETLRIYLATR